MTLAEVRERLRNVQRWLRKAKDRYYGARKNLREARSLIHKYNAELKEINKRLPKSQGGVKEKLEKRKHNIIEKRHEQIKRRDRLADQVHRRKQIYEHLEKKYKALQQLEDEKGKPNYSSTSGVSTPSRPWNPYNRPIANWMIPWLDKSWNAGWRGALNSGWRDPAYSTQLCYRICGRPSCPGTCAGAASNHSGSTYPAGAVDVSDYNTFESIQYRIGSPLRNYLGAADPVHFSISGR